MDDNIIRRSVKANDENRLAELGYEQELTRNWSLIHNFGVSFSIIVSILSWAYCFHPMFKLADTN